MSYKNTTWLRRPLGTLSSSGSLGIKFSLACLLKNKYTMNVQGKQTNKEIANRQNLLQKYNSLFENIIHWVTRVEMAK